MCSEFSLDEKFLDLLTHDKVLEVYNDLLLKKTDLLSGNIKIAKGYDGISYREFEKNFSKHAEVICSKGRTGKYLFFPFREVTVPKPPFEKDQLKEAIEAKKTRTLSISTIQDTLFQDVLISVLEPFAEEKFKRIDNCSYAYRKNKSSKKAVEEIQRNLRKGYCYILNGDIEKFFDKIDHRLLTDKVSSFFGKQNVLVNKFLYRFINVCKVPDSKMGTSDNKPIKRDLGIPQGGVLSGLLANIFLFDFDIYVFEQLKKIYDLKYIRYADDFVVMLRSSERAEEIFDKLTCFLKKEKLRLYSLSEKSKEYDLSKKESNDLEFLGFSISPQYLRIKKTNVEKFLYRVKDAISDLNAENQYKYLKSVCTKINPKIIGLENMISENGYCKECGRLVAKRNWVGYFVTISDVRQLRNIDTEIRRIIYNDYFSKMRNRLKKKDMIRTKEQLLSLERTFYKFRRQIRQMKKAKEAYCNCWRYYDVETKRIEAKKRASTNVEFKGILV